VTLPTEAVASASVEFAASSDSDDSDSVFKNHGSVEGELNGDVRPS
jgi:hypothetical protein